MDVPLSSNARRHATEKSGYRHAKIVLTLVLCEFLLSSCRANYERAASSRTHRNTVFEQNSVYLKPVEQWRIEAGNITGMRDGGFVATTGGQSGSWSYASLQYNSSVRPPYSITASMRRISSDTHRPVEIRFVGGYFAVSSNHWYLYESEENWTGWQYSASINGGENILTVAHDGRRVKGYINGTYVGSLVLQAPIQAGKPGIFFKGDPLRKSEVAFKNFTVTSR